MRRFHIVFILCLIPLFTSWGKERVYRRYLPDRIITLDPWKSFERYSQSIILQIYDPLFKTEDGIVPKPHIAKSFSYDPETKTYEISLRNDVYFHNGNPLTAEDVVFTLTRMCRDDSATSTILPLIKGCRTQGELGVSKTGPYKISIQLLKDFPPFMSFLASFRFVILPKNLADRNESDFFKTPVGTGPFIIKSLDKDSIVLRGNKSYFLGTPQIDKMVYYMESAEKIYARLQEGAIDDIFPLPPPEKYPENFQKVLINQASSTFLAFQPRVKPFDNIALRKAIQAAIHNSKIHKQLSQQEGFLPARGLIPWGAIGFDGSLPRDNYHPKKVDEWVKEAGYKNIQAVPELELRSVLKGPFREIIPKLVQENLRAVGFKVKLIHQTLPEIVKDIEKNKAGLFLADITLSSVDTYHFLELWRTTYTNKGLTVNDLDFEALMDEALKTADRYQRMEIYRKANRLLLEKTYVHPIGHIAHRTSLRSREWNLPKMNFLGPFFYHMHEAIYLGEGNVGKTQ